MTRRDALVSVIEALHAEKGPYKHFMAKEIAQQPGVLADALDVKLKATWLVCRKECIPQDGEFALKIPLRSSTALNGAAFDAALKSQPADVAGAHQVALKDDGKRLAVRVAGLPADVRGQPLELFPESPGVVVTAATPAKPGEPVGAQRPPRSCSPMPSDDRTTCPASRTPSG